MKPHPMIPPPKTDVDRINQSLRSALSDENTRLIAENKKLRYLVNFLWMNADQHLFSAGEQQVLNDFWNDPSELGIENPFTEESSS